MAIGTPVVHATVPSQTPDPDRQIRVTRSFEYPKQVWYLLVCFIALLALVHWSQRAWALTRKDSRVAQPVQRPSSSFRRLPLAVIDTFRAIAFRWTIPVGPSYSINLVEVFLTAGYIASLFAWSLMNTTNTKGLKFDPRYYGNRSGNIAAIQMTLATALGMKNNIISLLTGVSFDKLNYLHRTSARVICVLVWLHAGGRVGDCYRGLLPHTSLTLLKGKTAITTGWIRAGLLGGTALALLVVLSLRPVRRTNYEVFLWIHFVLVFILLVSAYFHSHYLKLGKFIWPSLLLWALDRFLRVFRMVLFNTGYFRGKKSQELDAEVEVLSSRFLRLTMYRPDHFHWAPGQSVYMTLPSVSAFPLEAHPFSIASVNEAKTNELNGDCNEKERSGKKLTFFIRVMDGFTKRLHNMATRSQTCRVLIDGPYSSPPILRGYDTIVLLSGGSGVSFTLPLMIDTIRRTKNNDLRCNHLSFIWVVKEADQITWISEDLMYELRDLPQDVSVDVQVFVTADVQSADIWDKNSEDKDLEKKSSDKRPAPSFQDLPCVQVKEGRPDIDELLRGKLARTHVAMSVNVCGAQGLVDASRKALRSPRFLDILRGGPTVSLHVEAFGNMVSDTIPDMHVVPAA
ncbi:hypothetical protein AMATHDRAFT_147750 [Amanita thiersii Skay4041]|uniref:ferric-chelate reductase (NADPH) n=1 Tax=Amanita thiersii Skay4041 TaxID=703135 RepID=A0A2A9NNW2_9AGAR|nr:hypothetical protein AMATHDRAFT_147750 [Amanita thiersii Skay4041]